MLPHCLKSSTYLLHFKIRSIIISFLWVLGYIGKTGNEYADSLTGSIINKLCSSHLKCFFSDLVCTYSKSIKNLLSPEWNNLPVSHVSGYRSITNNISSSSWFQSLNFCCIEIVKYSRLCSGHNLLPHHTYKLELNESVYCSIPNCSGVSCDFSHLLYCSVLSPQNTSFSLSISIFQLLMPFHLILT